MSEASERREALDRLAQAAKDYAGIDNPDSMEAVDEDYGIVGRAIDEAAHAAQVVPQPNREVSYWQNVIEARLLENGVGYEQEDWFANVIFSAAEAVSAILSAQPVEGEVEWAAQVSTSGLSEPVYFEYPNRLSVERFIKNPPLWFDRQDVTAKIVVQRTKAGPWIEVQP